LEKKYDQLLMITSKNYSNDSSSKEEYNSDSSFIQDYEDDEMHGLDDVMIVSKCLLLTAKEVYHGNNKKESYKESNNKNVIKKRQYKCNTKVDVRFFCDDDEDKYDIENKRDIDDKKNEVMNGKNYIF